MDDNSGKNGEQTKGEQKNHRATNNKKPYAIKTTNTLQKNNGK